MISQLTVFLENEKGRLAAACRAVSDAGINMHALNLADTSDFGVVRMLTDTPEAAAEALRGQGVAAQMMERIARSLRETGRKAIPTCSYAKKLVRPASGICRRASLNAHTQNAPSLKRTSALGKARFLFYFSGSRFRAARISRSSKEAMLSE